MQAAQGLGFSLNPLKAVKRVASGTVHVVTSAGKGVEHGVVKVAKVVEHGVVSAAEFSAMLALLPIKLALRPVKSRIATIEKRRAAKIAWDKRKSRTVTPADRSEAKSWMKSKLKKELPHGPLLALLAGPRVAYAAPAQFGAMSTNLGVAPAVIAALVPVFIALLNNLMKHFAGNGEAPVQIGPNGQILTPGDPTAVDPAAEAQAAAEAMQNAAAGAADQAAAADAGGDGGGAMMPGGHGGNANLMKWGAIGVGAVLLIMLLKPKSGGAAKPKKS